MDEPGCWVLLVAFIIIAFGAVIALLIEQGLGILILMLGLVILLVGEVSTLYLQKKNTTYVDDFGGGEYGHEGDVIRRLVRVENDQVVEFGRRLWGKENIHRVTVPFTASNIIKTEMYLRHVVEGVAVSVKVALSAEVEECEETETTLRNGFDPQALYDVLVRDGHGTFNDWLKSTYQMHAELTQEVLDAFENNLRDPYGLIEALREALIHHVEFNDWPFKNIKRITAKVTANSASFSTSAEYRGKKRQIVHDGEALPIISDDNASLMANS